jgi:hypothetical protein
MAITKEEKDFLKSAVQPLCKTLWWFLIKLKTKLSYDSAISLLGVHQKEMNLLCQRDSYTPMLLNHYSQ